MADSSNERTEEIIVHGVYSYKLNAVDDQGKKKYAVVYFESAINDVRLTGFKKIDDPSQIPEIDYDTDTLNKMLQALDARINFPKQFTPATASVAGADGAVPGPAAGSQNKYLRGDGTWQIPPGIQKLNGLSPNANGALTIKISQIENDARDAQGNIVGYALKTDVPAKFTPATASANGADGVVPGPVAGDQNKYLRGDGTWNIPYTHPTTAGNKHIPTGGSSGQILKYGGTSGTATWAAEYSYTHPTTAGNKHIPSGGSAGQILKYGGSSGTATWVNETTYSDFIGSGTAAAHGLVPKPPATAGTTKYLCENGTWTVPAGIKKLNNIAPDSNGELTIKVSQLENDARDSHGTVVGYALTTDIPSVWDSAGHLVSPAGWSIWITDETVSTNSGN